MPRFPGAAYKVRGDNSANESTGALGNHAWIKAGLRVLMSLNDRANEAAKQYE